MLSRWSPASDLLALNREMSNLATRMFGYSDAANGRGGAWVPPIESFYLDKNLVVRVWVPGIDASKVDIRVSGNLLSIKGERKFEYQVAREQFLFSEVPYGTFELSVTLPSGLKFDQVKAKYTNGVLEITLPIHESVLPKQVPVETQQSSQPAVAGTR
jgi:HSP20 family protein